MRDKYREFWYALGIIATVTVAYAAAARNEGEFPPASQLVGHGIGVLGFALMLMTETLYSLRKRALSARWGRMSSWLRFHMITGMVGPYMVLLHPAARFHGLAAGVAALTVIVVMSGLIGRYIYTAIPRTIDGAELEVDEIEQRIADLEQALAGSAVRAGGASGAPQVVSAGADAHALARATPQSAGVPHHGQHVATPELDDLRHRRESLRRQARSLGATRRTLALWHTVHVPLAMVLFATAFVHVLGALYFATLLR